MSIKLLIIFICAAVGTLAGFLTMRSYRRSYRYLDGVCSLINELRRNIAYRRDSVASILGSYSTESAQLKKNIAEYIAYASSKDGSPDISRGYLPATVHERVCSLFRALGQSDGEGEISELERFSLEFIELRDKAAQKSEKYGPLAVKLGFLFGLGVGVLFL